MIIRATEGLKITYKIEEDGQVPRSIEVIIARIPGSQVPECFMIREWEESTYPNGGPALTSSPVYNTKYSILFKNYTLTLDSYEIANKIFEVFLGDLEDFKNKKLKDVIPELYL